MLDPVGLLARVSASTCRLLSLRQCRIRLILPLRMRRTVSELPPLRTLSRAAVSVPCVTVLVPVFLLPHAEANRDRRV